MKHHLLLLISLLCSFSMMGQPSERLSLVQAYEMARLSSPLYKNQALLPQTTAIRLKSLDQSRLPSIQLKAEGRIQSEVVGLPEDAGIPLKIDLPLYNLKTYANVQYRLYDGGITQARKNLETLQLEVDKQSLEVELNGVKDQVNRFFLGAIFARKRAEILQVTLKDLGLRKEALQAGVTYGAVLQSEIDKLTVRELELQAEIDKVQNEIQSYLSVLGALTGKEFAADIALDLPEMEDFSLSLPITRPEQTLITQQQQALAANESLIQASRRPKISAFANGGFGYPNPLNFFDNNFSPYALGGLAFSWDMVDWGKANRDRQLLNIQRQMMDNRKEAFEFGLGAMEGKYREDIAGLENQIGKDQEIVALQQQILNQLAAQLEQGVITTNDYLIQTNAELQARQQLQLHQVQLIQTKIQYLTQQGAL